MKKPFPLMSWYDSMPIKRKMYLLFLSIASLLIVVITTAVYHVSASILISKTIASTQQNINLIALNLDNVLQNVEAYTNSATSNATLQRILSRSSYKDSLGRYSDSVSITGALDLVVSSGALIESFIIYDTNGHVFDSGKIQNMRVPDSTEYNFFWELPISKRQMWLDTHETMYTIKEKRQNDITYVKAFYNVFTGENMGIIQANINESHISDIYSKVPLGKTGRIFIINSDARIISSLDKATLYMDVRGEPYFPLLAEEEAGTLYRHDGTEYLVTYQKYDKLDWTIIGVVPADELTQEKSILIVWVVATLIIGLLTLNICIMMLSNSMFMPILQLKKVIEHIAEGDLEERAEIFHEDEVGMLAREFNNMVQRISDLMGNLVEEQKKKRQHELSLLQSQINPHFLYNTLENLCGLAELGQKEELLWLVNELALFYRGVLSGGSMVISIREELDITEKYLNILQITAYGKLVYTVDVDEDIMQYSTIKLLFQPLIENAFQHGIKYKDIVGNIVITGRMDCDTIVFTVTDNGIGISKDDLKTIFTPRNDCYRPKSFGISSTDERIKMYFGSQYGLSVDSDYSHGTTVTIRLSKKLNGG